MIDRYTVLLVDDETTNNMIIKRFLEKEGYEVDVCLDGLEAVAALEKRPYDVIVSDWMMPKMDGIELIRKVRESIDSPPYIIMLTALVSEEAKEHSLDAGADYYLGKPVDNEELVEVIHQGTQILDNQKRNDLPASNKIIQVTKTPMLAPFVAVGITASTGGPPTITNILKNIDPDTEAAFFVIQHGPEWMLDTFARRLSGELGMNVTLAKQGDIIKPKTIYIPPGDYNMSISHDFKVHLEQSPKENFVRPAADPTFRSMAQRFGAYSVAVVLTGLGKDGGSGIENVNEFGGRIIVQEPSEAIAKAMPSNALSLRIKNVRVEESKNIAAAIEENVFSLNARLKSIRRELEENES
jgi:two-component system chemotaxis response regulator CheB